ncbi:MAG: hypothetical protein R3290_09240, partial [Acidimicrobiia bacterium]|nr:hypothetical protein [Acidimicrobiia bacterium]
HKASGPGNVQIGVDASTWESGSPSGPGLYPIGGSGQVNGEFVIAERYGIQIGIRAQERFLGTLEAFAGKGNRSGVYFADAGFSSGTRGTWNYDWHVDLRDAHGVAKGTTLADYNLTLETDAFDSLFGFDPADLTFGGLLGDAVLYQGSFNPDFGNDDYDATVETTYTFRLVLTPKTFNGPPLAAAMSVVVTD